MTASHWILAIVIAAASAGLEAWLSGPKPFSVLKSFKQPRWSLPIFGWMAVGGAFYLIMTFALATSLAAGSNGYLAASLVVLVMVTDGFWNLILFRKRQFWGAFWYLFPYTALVLASVFALWNVDFRAALLVSCYAAFLAYDFCWAFALARLNNKN